MIHSVCQTVIEHMMKISRIVPVNLDVLVVVRVQITMAARSLQRQQPHRRLQLLPQPRRLRRFQSLQTKLLIRQY